MAPYDPTSDVASDAQAIIEAARLGAAPSTLEVGEFHIVSTSEGISAYDLTKEEFLRRTEPSPKRKTGEYEFTEPESFSTFVNNHGQSDRTTLFADRDHGRIIAILNGPEEHTDQAGWCDFRATLRLRQTEEWKEWEQSSGNFFEQAAFADFLEDHLLEIREPDSATLLEIATTISGSKGANFKSAVRTDSGAITIAYEESLNVSAGKAGRLEIPTRITLGISPYEGGDPYKLTARFRYRIHNGALTLGYVLDRPRNVLRDAFQGAVDSVAAETGLDVLFGTPRL